MIEFEREAYDDVVRRADAGGAEEVCGVLAGTRRDGDEPSVVARAHEAENVADAPETRYRIDPETQLELFESIEADGRDVVGFYHSHPTGPARPSETDAARATWPGYSYVICALDGRPFVGSWRWRGDEAGFEQETVAVRSVQ
ncbi:Proteasome lid subunit RPN8/RPN11, contains Jab1/MPN metalloenzyme (JAMM) motif [Halorubrum xinjiangense]|uniref:Proteasome lid subunit RPN8/RPN11, contains Jab1/MPN metalloenzyme (JAMM) motif n=1 Tax=Halorubrum xinjiangense TaxID=261291 RepID=A0A1G7J1Q2_9EURY|nr:desampylase [Halorubrum xinjiangense]SDF18805.1 Proteasome lid subunit RPN8/RPN11, contains Jab1/MPN metalloenzyme (JAMM) motif [Halorubrum xinjiangense]